MKNEAFSTAAIYVFQWNFIDFSKPKRGRFHLPRLYITIGQMPQCCGLYWSETHLKLDRSQSLFYFVPQDSYSQAGSANIYM